MPASFLIQAAEDPVLALPALLTLGVLLVNGWTDEPQETRECHAPPPGGVRNAECRNTEWVGKAGRRPGMQPKVDRMQPGCGLQVRGFLIL